MEILIGEDMVLQHEQVNAKPIKIPIAALHTLISSSWKSFENTSNQAKTKEQIQNLLQS